ncbi:hypothetical protein JAO73_10570 [Hymenobacter sp. BT523]|uniref:hypothetical protein n=1 Tax=Hymenobacter sp. BT523 TaxID=2795725 RepID=UPI0018EC82AB|nr:hypothetical protein [Hymenobacter sp. BT523]MBJ6109459.1 hypothetical protein [Hymenobacter sp. BT523]
MFTPPAELLQWLNRQRPADKAGQKAVLTIRWLISAELDRAAPDPPPRAITHFTPDDGPGAQ